MRKILLFAAAAMILPGLALAKTILPDACGANDVKFEVKTTGGQHPPVLPPPGKALLVLILDDPMMTMPFHYVTMRYGVDGAWVGANYGKSYFTVVVDPGEHHLCASWQSAGMYKNAIGTASFTAEAGKSYYYAASVSSSAGGNNTAKIDFDFSQMEEDDGKYRVKAWKLAVSKPNK